MSVLSPEFVIVIEVEIEGIEIEIEIGIDTESLLMHLCPALPRLHCSLSAEAHAFGRKSMP